MRGVRVNIHNEWADMIIDKRDKNNILMANNVVLKRKV